MKNLQESINEVNRRYLSGKNDDDQVKEMIKLDKKTKGFSFIPEFETYRLCTDFEKLSFLVEKFGYWSDKVQEFNKRLNLKGGAEYKTELNNRILAKN